MPSNVKILGLLGLIPFILLAIHSIFVFDWFTPTQAKIAFVQYSAVILSFLGGIHWFQALIEPKNKHQIYVSMLPSIIGWASLLVFNIKITLLILSVSYLLILLYDKFTLTLPKHIVIEYTAMRLSLTSVVVISHVLIIAFG